MTVFFSADTHFGHRMIIQHSHRPFDSVEEMNEVMIQRWNERVKKGDLVYFLGDLCWENLTEIRKKLNGQIFLIVGNHDKEALKYPELFVKILPLHHIHIQQPKNIIVLCHYSMRVWNRSHFNSYHLYGHSHSGLPEHGKSYNVGVDRNNFYPVSLDEIKAIMTKLPDNPDYIAINKGR